MLENNNRIVVVQACAQGCSAAAQHRSAQQARLDCGQPALCAALALPADSPQFCTGQVAPHFMCPLASPSCIDTCVIPAVVCKTSGTYNGSRLSADFI